MPMLLRLRLLRLLPVPRRWKLEWELVLLRGYFKRRIERARRAKDQAAVEGLEEDSRYEVGFTEQELSVHQTRQLLREARKLRVPTPVIPHDPENASPRYWVIGNYDFEFYLTEEGVKAVRKEIREEQRWQMERRAQWVPWVNAIIAFLSVIVSVVVGYFLGRTH